MSSAIKRESGQHASVTGPTTRVLMLLGGLAVAAMLLALSIGAVPMPLLAMLSGGLNETQELVLLTVRLPRVVLCVVVGASLAVSGAAMQGLFRNPLADPGLIGISSGAALAVGLMIVFAGSAGGFMGLYGLSIAAFAGGLLACLVIFHFAQLAGTFSVTYMLLAGIAINALAFAGTSSLQFISDDQQLRALAFWTMGSLGGALWPAVLVAGSVVVPATLVLLKSARQLNILLLGDSEARHLGVNDKRLKYIIIVCCALSVGAAVAVSGIIGFVGLIVPHLIRLSIGSDHRMLIPASALAGATLVLLADIVARVIVLPAEMPVGILTSLIGGPFFLWLLIRQYSGRFGV